jgi:hypothetical protein
LHIETSLIGIGSIWRTCNGSAANEKVSWLERPSILSWISSLPAKLFPTSTVQNTAWGDTAWGDTAGRPLGARGTLKHHSLDLYGGHVMVQRQLIQYLG